MKLDKLIEQFKNFEYAEVGKGYKHPISPNLALRDDCEEFFSEYPSLREDEDYVKFMEVYAGAVIDHPEFELMVDIYGLSLDLTINVLHPDESLVERERFFGFGEVDYHPLGKTREDASSASFFFNLTDISSGVYRRPGVYKVDYRTVPIKWYCSSFIEWFEKLVQASGKLID